MTPDPADFSEAAGDAWPAAMPADPVELAALDVNRSFYEAFESGDFNAMSDLWVHEDRSVCVHPGWTALRGWASIAASWVAMFDGPQHIQFIVTDEHVTVNGDSAWVSCDENILTPGASATVNALNVFERSDDGLWRMVAHHGAPVMIASDDLDDEVDDD